jgi:hypothetical protein
MKGIENKDVFSMLEKSQKRDQCHKIYYNLLMRVSGLIKRQNKPLDMNVVYFD